MGQMDFFDIEKRYAGLDAQNDPLLAFGEAAAYTARAHPRGDKPG